MSAVTVNIVSYRYGHLAAHAIESVLSQTCPPAVVRVFDDGAGDCRHLRALYPEVEVIERPENLGIVGSMNDALQRTQTPRCMMLGADNYLRPDALEKLEPFTQDIVSYDLILCGVKANEFASRIGASVTWCGHRIWRFTKGNLGRANYIHGSSVFNTDLAKAVGYRRSGHPTHSEEDWMLWRGMIEQGASHHHHQEGLMFYRRHRANFQP